MLRNLSLLVGILTSWALSPIALAEQLSEEAVAARVKAAAVSSDTISTTAVDDSSHVASHEVRSTQKVRNVILMIGDGMGPQQLGLLFAYAHHARATSENSEGASIENLLKQGANLALVRTEPHGVLVVDSAAAATQLATGQLAGSEMIGANFRGDAAPTVLEFAQKSGKATGLVSDTRITHATPAAFASHQRHRSLENEIAVDLLEKQVDVLFSGGLRHWIPEATNIRDSAAFLSIVQLIGDSYQPSSKRRDNRNLLLEARNNKYQLVFDRHELKLLDSGKALGLFANSEMLDAVAARNAETNNECSEPTLAEMAGKAIEVLEQDPEGFFLMIEGGQIDWAGHNNDSGTLLAELQRFDAAVREVFRWAKHRDDTLVLVTADHETGSFGFSYSGKDIPPPQTLDGDVFEGRPFQPNFNFAPQNVLNKLAKQKKSYFQIFTEFDALEAEEQTPETLQQIVNEAVAPFSITLKDAVDILTRSVNRNYVEDHPYLGTKTLPEMPDQESFYVYGENLRMNRLAHILSEQQCTVWGTGTHTSTPVPLVAFGPASENFTGILHSTDIGKRMIELVSEE